MRNLYKTMDIRLKQSGIASERHNVVLSPEIAFKMDGVYYVMAFAKSIDWAIEAQYENKTGN